MSSFAYADPPYLGQSKRLYGDHPDYAGEVDHKELIDRLESDYDGWALSASMKSIPTLARLLPVDVLTLSWVKRTAPPLGDHRHYSWEPVFLRAVRRPGPGYVMSHLDCIPQEIHTRFDRHLKVMSLVPNLKSSAIGCSLRQG